MSARAWLGTIIWVVGFNLAVALVAYLWSVSWAIIIFSLRYILLSTPKGYELWRRLVVGAQEYSRLPKLDKKWPTPAWYLSTLVGILLSISSLIWLNEPLKVLLDRI
jgi:hypothetical protein